MIVRRGHLRDRACRTSSLVIGVLLWTGTARIVRAQVKSIRERVYVKRARSLGAGHTRIIARHVLPQVAPLLVANTVLTIAVAIFDETALSFLGLGDPQLDRPSGKIIENAFQRSAISAGAWWAIVPPGVVVRSSSSAACWSAGSGGRPQPAAPGRPPVGAELPLRPSRPGHHDERPAGGAMGLNVWFDIDGGRQLHAVQGVDLASPRASASASSASPAAARPPRSSPSWACCPERQPSPARSCSTARTSSSGGEERAPRPLDRTSPWSSRAR